MAKFTAAELNVAEHHPDALRAIADYHDQQESQADAMGMDSCAEHHKARRQELNREADRIQADWEGGSTTSGDGDAGK